MIPKEDSHVAFYVSGYMQNIGRAMVIAAVDFYRPGMWLTEAYVLFSDEKMSDGIRVVTTYDPIEIPKEWLPTLHSEMENRLKFSESMMFEKIREHDRELAHWLHECGGNLNGPLTSHGVAQAHLSGDFKEQILDLLGFTEITALKEFLEPMKNLPIPKRKVEQHKA